jgi:hypothetical protein
MIKRSTLLVLGAGASEPYGYPIGSALKEKIITEITEMVKSDSGWVNELGFDIDFVSDFVARFIISPRPSIDSFLAYDKEEFSEIGKIAIVDAISKCEKFNNFNSIDDDWYTYFTSFLYKCHFDDICNNKIGIISFNYDRSLEWFLYHTLLASYEEGDYPEKCVPKLKGIPIAHIYGRLDQLPWENSVGRAYGNRCSNEELFKISKNINLIHEIKGKQITKQANSLIEKADKVYFLGLDLRNRENLEILDLSVLDGKSILGTGYQLKEGEITQICSNLNSRMKECSINISGYNIKSLEAIRTYMPFE